MRSMLALLLLAAASSCGSGSGETAKEGAPCGEAAEAPCGGGLFCRFPDGNCGQGAAEGVCAAVPEACIELYQPVCGCDSQTYSNACFALMARQSVQYTGECEKSG